MRIIGKAKSEEIDVKRFNLPGVKLTGKCPECKVRFERDFAVDYLSYPKANKPFDHGCYCHDCGHEWDVSLTLTIALTITA